MTVHCKVDANRGVLVATVEEPWAARELTEIADQMRDDPAFGPSTPVIVDFRNITSIPSTAEIEAVAAYFGHQDERRGVRRALVASADLHYGMARIAAAHSESHGLEVQVFRDLDAALAWLGV
jgi:hypothetical protein